MTEENLRKKLMNFKDLRDLLLVGIVIFSLGNCGHEIYKFVDKTNKRNKAYFGALEAQSRDRREFLEMKAREGEWKRYYEWISNPSNKGVYNFWAEEYEKGLDSSDRIRIEKYKQKLINNFSKK